MSTVTHYKPLIAIALFGACFLAGEETKNLTARQLYNFKPAPVQPANLPATTVKPTTPKQSQPKSTATAKATEPEAQYLGLKYTLLDGKTLRAVADANAVFSAGDRIRLQVESNTSGYLYVLNRDPKGQWELLFPSAEVVHNNNWIDKDTPKEVPQGQNFIFDNESGNETVFVVLSKQREPEVEKLIEMVRNNRPPARPSQTVQAANHMPAEADLLSNGMKSRALKVEPAGKDVYVVVNDPGDRRIVTEIVLKHK